MTAEKLFEEYTENPPVPIMSRYVYENSGHKLLCYKCQDFKRTKAEIVLVEDIPYLRITCKTCETYSDFMLRYDCIVPKKFDKLISTFVRKRIKELFRRPKDATNSS